MCIINRVNEIHLWKAFDNNLTECGEVRATARHGSITSSCDAVLAH